MRKPADVTIRSATAHDYPAIVQLLSGSLGWADDERHRQLFTWKHWENPFGPSPGWIALDEEGIVGSRTLMRWEFTSDAGRLRAVRAVDTATHPRARGRGVFRALTMRAVEELTSEGVDWAFNTPNDQSLPGYLSMGWQAVGRLPVSVRVARVTGLARLRDARRRAGDLWSLPTSCGEDAASVLEASDDLMELLATQCQDDRIRTRRSVEYLRWRYGSSVLPYRVLLPGRSPRDGMVFFRLRTRGEATEAVIAETLMSPAGTRSLVSAVGRIIRGSTADYGVALGRPRLRRSLPLPGGGPLLTWRPLSSQQGAPLERWDLCAGDIELF